MRFRKMMRRGRTSAVALLLAGALAFGAVQSTPGGAQEIHSWSQARTAYVDHGPQGLASGDAPHRPSTFVLVSASSDGATNGLEISALAQHLGREIAEGSADDGEQSAETAHELVCFAISWLLENRVDPGGPREMARTIDIYLVANEFPRLDYPKVRNDLEKIYVTFKQALSTDELAREVADALCEALT